MVILAIYQSIKLILTRKIKDEHEFYTGQMSDYALILKEHDIEDCNHVII